MTSEPQTSREWAAALSPGDCELIVHGALRAGDMEAVVAAMHLLATKDPHRAQQLLDVVQVALDVAKAGPGTVAEELRAMASQIDRAGDRQ